MGRGLSLQEDDGSDSTEDVELHANREQVHDVLKEELKDGQIEAAVLDITRRGNNKFRSLQPEEIESLTADWL